MLPIRILVGDNDPDIANVIVEQLRELDLEVGFQHGTGSDQCCVWTADSPASARKLIEQHYFDVAFIDLRFDDNDQAPAGLGVLRDLTANAPSCRRVLMTAFGRENYQDFMGLTSTHAVINKNDMRYNHFAQYISTSFEQRLKARWSITGVHEAAEALNEKRHRIRGLRTSLTAIEQEVSTLLFSLFDASSSLPLMDSGPTIELSLMTGGLSASVVCMATPDYGENPITRERVLGNRCVVKIGRLSALREESQRFRRLVQLAIPSELRVELFSSAETDALAGVCYSFAGGSDAEIRSLDDLIARKNHDQVASVINRVISVARQRWYAVHGHPVAIGRYYHENFQSDFEKSVRGAHGFLEGEAGLKVLAERGIARGNGGEVPVMVEALLGQGVIQRPVATRLVHGDLHGGNVLIDSNGRVCVIDYANAGFGPKFADNAALQTSLRVQSVERSFHRLSSDERTAIFIAMFNEERSILNGEPVGLGGWARSSCLTDQAFLDCYSGSSDESESDLLMELRVTQLLYSMSVLQRPWDDDQRLRLLTWQSALRSTVFPDWPNGSR